MKKSLSKVCFQVSHKGSAIATFKTKSQAVAFTKAGAVYTDQDGWLVRQAGAAKALGLKSIDAVCEIKKIHKA